MHRCVFVKQIFLGCTSKRRPMCIGCAEVSVPCVEMGVEMYQRNLAEFFIHRAQQRHGDCMISTEAYDRSGFFMQVIGSCLNLSDRLFYIKGVAANIACISYLYRLEWLGIVGWMKISA